MGNALCLNRKVEEENQVLGRSSPPALLIRKRSLSISKETSLQGQLQDVCVRAIGAQLLKGQVSPSECAHKLPLDLLQRVLDHVIGVDQLALPLLQQLMTPWLHHLHLAGLPGVDNAWLPVIARAKHLRALDLSGCSMLSDAGTAWLSWLWQLTELRLQHCCGITDAGLAHISGLTALRVLDLEGCEGLSSSSLVAVGQLAGLTSLNLAQCPGVRGAGVRHIKGLQQLRQLSLGWCRDLGDTSADASNSVAALACLSRLSSLSLAGTRADDAQLVALLPRLQQLQVLDLSGSGMSERGLPCLAPLAGSLSVLNLRGCQVGDGPGPAALALLTGLVQLDLSCSGLGRAGLLALVPLAGLTELNLDMCSVGDEGCRVFRQLVCLERLDLSDTDIGDAGVGCLARCRRLAWLSLCNTEVGDCCTAALTHLTRLSHLNLDARSVSEASLRLMLPLAGQLRELDMYGARVGARGAALLAAAYTGLQRLDLCGGHVTDRACVELAKLPSLRQLNLSQNRQLGDAGLRALAGGRLAASLECLNLSYTSITDAAVPALAGLKALQVVVLSGVAVSEAAAARLKRARPKLQIKATGRKSCAC